MDVHPQVLTMATLDEYVEAAFRPVAVDKGLGFRVEVSPDVPEQLFTDEQRLQQVLRNLLSNAVKFTSAGDVKLRISRARNVQFTGTLAAEPDVVAFAVSDTGVGIAEAKLRVIFDAFQQADGTTSRRYGGTGLGLSISRDIARLLGGEVRATSRVGHGSTFTMFLPVRYGQPQPLAAVRRTPTDATPPADFSAISALGQQNRQGQPSHRPARVRRDREPTLPTAPDPGDPLNGAKILIIDDDVRTVFALTSVFERCGAQVLYAENGREGVDVLERADDVVLVLMDVMMPELDGYATTEAIRRMPQFADLPIIALTAKAMKGDREKSIAAGATDYIPKPVDVEHLLRVMRQWLDRVAARQPIR